MASSRVVAAAFGASFAILTTGWTRGLGQALGGDGLARHLALGAFLLAVAWGAWRREFPEAWRLRHAGPFAALVAYLAPAFEREASRIYHAVGGGLAGAAASGALALLLALQPGAGVGRAIARLLAEGAVDAVAPALAGAAGALALLDLLPLGLGWGEALLLLAAVGVSLPLRSPARTSAVPETGDQALPALRRGALGAVSVLCGASATLLVPPLLGYAAQFHPGRPFDHGAVHVSLLACAFVGAVAFGGLIEGRERLPAGFGFAGLAGGASILSLSLVLRLTDPDFFRGYEDLFERKAGATEGSLPFDAVFACGLGSLASFALGASLRCGLGGSRGALAGPAAAGCAGGVLLAPVLLADDLVRGGVGFRGLVLVGGIGIAAAGALGALLAPGSVWVRLVSTVLPVAAAAAAASRAPEAIRISNPFNPVRVEVFHTRESLDGLVTTASIPSGDPIVRLDRAMVTNDGPATAAGRKEIALSCALARRLDRVLLVGTPIPRLVGLLRLAGARRVEAAPSSLSVGKAAQFFASSEEAKVAALHRAPSGLPGPYDLVLLLPEPSDFTGSSRAFAAGRLRALSRLGGPEGTVAVWADASTLPLSALEALQGAVSEVFPETWVALRGFGEVSVGFLRGAAPVDPGRLGGRVFRDAGLLVPADVEGLRLDRELTLALAGGGAGLHGCFPAFSRIASAPWRPPERRDIDLPFWRPAEGGGAAALARLAGCAGEGPLQWLLRGLGAHASAQMVSAPGEPEWEKVEVSEESAPFFVRAAAGAPEPVSRCIEAWGDLLLRKREYNFVYRRFTEIVEASPSRPDFRRILAAAHLELLDPEGALAHLDRAVQAAPDDPLLLALRARALAEAGDRPGARAFLEEHLERHPKELGLLLPLARLLHEMGEPERARGLLERASAVAPHDPEVGRLRALLEERQPPPQSRPESRPG